MLLRRKILAVLTLAVLLPMFFLWAAHVYLHKESVSEFRQFYEKSLMDWYDGEVENMAYESSMFLQRELDRIEAIFEFKASQIQFISTQEPPAADIEGSFLDVFENTEDLDGAYYQFISENGLVVMSPSRVVNKFSKKLQNSEWFQRALNSDRSVIHVGEYDFGDDPIKLIFARRIEDFQGRVLGVLVGFYNMPSLFYNMDKEYLAPSIKRNTQVSGYLLRSNALGDLELVVEQRKDYHSKKLFWGLPFVSGWLSDEAELLGHLKSQVLLDNKVVMTKTSIQEEPYIWAFAPIQNGTFYFGLLIPLQSVVDQVQLSNEVGVENMNFAMSHYNVMFLLLLIYVAFIGWLVSHYILKRLQNFYQCLKDVDETGVCKPFDEGDADELTSLYRMFVNVFKHQQMLYYKSKHEKKHPLKKRVLKKH